MDPKPPLGKWDIGMQKHPTTKFVGPLIFLNVLNNGVGPRTLCIEIRPNPQIKTMEN